ncbi:hypothetical protein BC826DRAFT_418309 [Russula brevipes]|nr:hypothetical protein BC826DRAFT_418309 [Russula brevipes]
MILDRRLDGLSRTRTRTNPIMNARPPDPGAASHSSTTTLTTTTTIPQWYHSTRPRPSPNAHPPPQSRPVLSPSCFKPEPEPKGDPHPPADGLPSPSPSRPHPRSRNDLFLFLAGGGSGPTFYHNNNNNHKNAGKTPIHAAVLQDGTSVFHVEGYVNTPELSAGRGGGLSQGLPANGPYKSLFRARSESRCGSGKTAPTTTAAAAAAGTAPDAGLHVLADAAQSPEAQSPVSAASPAPARTPVSVSAPSPAPAPAPPSATSTSTPRKRRKPSPLVPSSPAPSVTSLGSVVSVAQPRPLLNNAVRHSSPTPVFCSPASTWQNR